MEKGGAWFALSLLGLIGGGLFGSFLGLLLMVTNKGAAVPIAYSKYGFYIGAFFGAHVALSIGMRKFDPDANSGTKLQVFGVFGALVPMMFLFACSAIGK